MKTLSFAERSALDARRIERSRERLLTRRALQDRERAVAPFICRLKRARCFASAKLVSDDVRDACRRLRARTTYEERAELVRLLDDLKNMTPTEREAADAYRAMVTGEAS